MLKVGFYPGETEHGHSAVPLFNRATDSYFEKVAAAHLLPEVVKYIETLRPSQDACYNLVNAMGAGEFFGSNINGDYFTEESLIHRPDDWTGNPLIDKIRAKDWAYGFPTFYYAHPYAHHRNKDASRAFGEVELAVWNDRMKRVELVTRVDKDKCQQFGGTAVWDKLVAGMYPDVSMGCKVPFDTCSICLDWKMYREAMATFVPGKHKSPGEAILHWHKTKHKIRGLSITRADYCDHAKKEMNKIWADGRKVWVFNDFPKFFDISFVFIGADRTAKTMMKIAGMGGGFWDIGSSVELAEKLGYREDEDTEKTASADPAEASLSAFDRYLLGKNAKAKRSEMVKDIIPSQFAGKAIPALTATESDLPRDLLDTMGKVPVETALSTSGGLGIVLRPREFQRVVLVNIGKKGLADDYDDHGIVFPESDEKVPMDLGPGHFLGPLARLLMPLFSQRSALAPAIEKRIIVIAGDHPMKEKKSSSSHSTELLRKIGAAYNSYREQLMDLVAHSQNLIGEAAYPFQADFRKLSAASPEEIFSPLSVAYIKSAFLNEVGPRRENGQNKLAAIAGVERGLPSRNT